MAFARRTKPLLGSHRMVKNNVLTQNELETLFDPKFITEAIKERTQYKEIVKDDERTFQDIERKTTSMIANDESGKQIQVDYKQNNLNFSETEKIYLLEKELASKLSKAHTYQQVLNTCDTHMFSLTPNLAVAAYYKLAMLIKPNLVKGRNDQYKMRGREDKFFSNPKMRQISKLLYDNLDTFPQEQRVIILWSTVKMRFPMNRMIDKCIQSIFADDISMLAPHQVSMLAWAMARTGYTHQAYVNTLIHATDSICNHCSNIWRLQKINDEDEEMKHKLDTLTDGTPEESPYTFENMYQEG
eukprot:CAMPEP_0197017272 /NCGR_PEP_ID=MMETSP1380-20130617/79447_1 /TAXON_ID=5936 /ORGANISM="Euplotes crassus, Strain CT5" /LENGTH=299 /DNA_ID=CAMNT_0042444355 /DNA_START=47 /DNA_END=947 /DNA_ORIENTATION=-